MTYTRSDLPQGWVICEAGKDFKCPSPACTFAFDTETFAYIRKDVLDAKVTFVIASTEEEGDFYFTVLYIHVELCK